MQVRPGRPAAALVGVLLALGLAVAVPAAPAAAHARLTGTTPADGATVDAAPTAVTLAFTEVVRGDFTTVTVTDPAGAPATAGEPRVVDGTVTQPITVTGSGAYAVAWRVVSADGHPLSGQLTFTVDLPAAPTPAAPTPAAPTPTAPGPAPTPPDGSAPPGSTGAPATDTVDPSPAAARRETAGAMPWLVGGALVVAALVVLLIVLGRRRPRVGPS